MVKALSQDRLVRKDKGTVERLGQEETFIEGSSSGYGCTVNRFFRPERKELWKQRLVRLCLIISRSPFE